ncbi:MAG: hypothetical protein PHW69_02545 [Elusimicrobiaceae bacterium]|nr:hypothetical protein [Elusimicrobiaceae bacterium]
MKYEIKAIPLMSLVFSAVPLVVSVIGLIAGLMTFVIAPSPYIEPMTTTSRIAGVLIFAVLYMVAIMGIQLACAFIYNLFCSVLGLRGIKIDLVQAEEVEDAAE